MAEYIERKYVLKCMEDSYKNAGISAEARAKMTRWLDKAPAADVRPVARGSWMKRRFSENCVGYECLNCHTTWDAPTNFCPNCGAKMEDS